MELQTANEFTFINQQNDLKCVTLNLAELQDDFVFNRVQGMQVDVLSTIVQDTLKANTEDMYSDFITFDASDLTSLVPVAAADSPEWSTSSDSLSWAASPESLTSIEDTEATLYSPENYIMSPLSPENSPGYETSVESLMLSPMSSSNCEKSITLVVSPEDVFNEQAPPKRKRGRKKKSETGEYAPPKPKKPRKTKVYEIETPFEDKEQERKRLSALNAKRHRDIQKKQKENLEKELQEVKNERDILKKEVESLQEKEVDLSQQLQVFKAHFGTQAISLVTLLQAGQVSF